MDFLARYGIAPDKIADAGLVLAAYAIGVLSLHLAYRAGGRTWVRRHGLVWKAKDRRRLISGFYPEWLLFSACAVLVLVVDFAMRNVGLLDLLSRHAAGSFAIFAAVAAIIAAYSIYTVNSARGDPRESANDVARLGRAYTAYAPYTIILSTGGALVIYLLISQFIYDQTAFRAEAAQVIGLLKQSSALHAAHVQAVAVDPSAAVPLYAQALANMEQASGRVALAVNLLQEQMNPVFIFATAVFAVNILIRFTPARNAFLDGARTLTLVSTGLAIGIAVLFGLYLYFGSYGALLDDAIALLAHQSPDTRLGASDAAAWQMTQRFNEILVDLTKNNNLFNFIAAIGGEGSGLATFVFGIQFTLGRIQDNELQKAADAAQILSYAEWREGLRKAPA